MPNTFHMAICDNSTEKLEAAHELLLELNDSELVTRIGSELAVSVPDLLEAISALLGAVREERAEAEK